MKIQVCIFNKLFNVTKFVLTDNLQYQSYEF